MNENIYDQRSIIFLGKLKDLGSGEKARLKRCAGRTLTEARQEALGVFFRVLPPDIPPYQYETFFLVATLYPVAEEGGSGNLGDSLRLCRIPNNEKSLDRRMEILLDSDEGQIPYRLRQVVHLFQTNRIRINWPQLLEDLLKWTHPDHFIQRRWAQSYFTQH